MIINLKQLFMKKRSVILIMLIFSMVGSSFAQERTIKGTVTSAEDGLSLPGVNVVVKGTSIGAVTDAKGQYSIAVPSDAQTLVFSFIGMQSQEVAIGNSGVIDVPLKVSAEALQEVIVTALGIRKNEKSIGYSVTRVAGSEFVQARETNVGNALVGRIAGVSVAKPVTGAAGSSRIVIRGSSSISGNNQPLIVIDGVPMDNQNLGNAGMWGGSDGGDGISSINPDDIETMTVLKGGSAAAIYGSLASNGAILITTKSGKNSNGISVEFNSNYTIEKAVSYLDWQTEYGQGSKGHAPETLTEARQDGPGGANLHLQSFGGKLDGHSVINWDGVMRPYSYAGNAQDAFYERGSTFTNTLAVTGGNENANFRMSASDLKSESVIPNAPMRRTTFAANTNFKKGKVSGGLSGTYMLEDVQNATIVADVPQNTNTPVVWWTTSVPISTVKGDPDKPGADPVTGMELLPTNDIWGGNPWWAAYQAVNDRKKDRMIGSAMLRYDPTEWLYLQVRMGLDKYNRSITQITPTGQGYSPTGDYRQTQQQYGQTNNEILVGFNKALDMGLGINAFAGGNMMKKKMDTEELYGSTFAIPFFHSLMNTVNPSRGLGTIQSGINSVYYSAEFSYKSIYLTTTGRQDWFSTLDGKAIFYPSVSLSAVLSDLVNMPVFDFLKLRTAWSQVGGATSSPYSTSFSYALGTPHNGFAQGSISNGGVPNNGLRPLTSNEYEFGADMRFFGNRLGIDVTYYNRKSNDDILNVLLAPTTGYNSTQMNIGEVTNKGIELLITGTIIKQSNFEWKSSLNFTNNKSKVVNLLDPEINDEKLQVDNSRTFVHWIYQVEGLPYGQVTVYDFLKDESGEKIVDVNGMPQKGDLVHLGPGTAPTFGGWSNNFRYKNFIADFLIDYQFGGWIGSGTDFGGIAAGLSKYTLPGRDVGIGTVSAADVNTYYEFISDNIGIASAFQSDFIKLRQVSVGYNVPLAVLNKAKVIKGLTISLVARNFWIIMKKTDNIDPESNYQNGNNQGLEFGGLPSIRSMGFNLNAKF
jgi:TonB-linked SusC/RagA family outer membrane protein